MPPYNFVITSRDFSGWQLEVIADTRRREDRPYVPDFEEPCSNILSSMNIPAFVLYCGLDENP
jgi:hypothetical protein